MVKSDLATEVVDFGTRNSNPRNQKVCRITIHHMAGNLGAVECAKMHMNTATSSANYYIGSDGTICAGVSEDRRAWTSGSRENDHSAITIEVANNSGAPNWTVSDKAYKACIALCADICQRYGINPHYNGEKTGTLTIHRMFQNTDCCGAYLIGKHEDGSIERDIIEKMGGASGKLYKVQTGAFAVKENAERQRDKLVDLGFKDAFIVEV
jgi:hypothetical protein